jgi:ABC-type antimicrobial peptide transport system permease subunit
VLHDAKYNSVRDTVQPTEYIPYQQTRMTNSVFEVRTAAAPAGAMGSIRDVSRQIDPNLPLTDVSTQVEQVEKRFQQERLFAQAYALFGALALLLASIGLFGLMSYNVSRRTNEIGVRMALGAQPRDVLRQVMGESMLLVAIGALLGVAAALGAARLIATQLFGVPPTDVAALATALAIMAGVSAFAGYLPARRASRVDPMVALRYE